LGAAGAFTLQAWSGGQTGLFLGLVATGVVVYLVALGRFRPDGKVFRDIALAAVLALALNVPFLLPYLKVQKELGLHRSLQEATYWSPNKESFVASPTHVDKLVLRALGWERRVLGEARAYLFPGLLPLLLAAIALRRRLSPEPSPPTSPRLDLIIVFVLVLAAGLEASGGFKLGSFSASGGRLAIAGVLLLGIRFALYRRRPFARGYLARFRAWTDGRMGVPAGYYLFVGALSLWASLGPAAGLYTALYRFVPGFDFIRVPSRLTILTVLALAVLAGFGVEFLVAKRRALAPLALVLVLAELAAFPLDTREDSVTTSPMDLWLAARADRGAIVALPIPDPRDEVAAARRHSTYMLDSIVHFRPLVNGYSGFTPASHVRLFRILTTFPDDAGLTELEKLGVRHAVFHRRSYSDEEWERVLRKAAALSDRLSLAATFDEGRVYEITRSSRRGS